jgi:putative transposase
MKKAFKRHGSPEAIKTDGLHSHGAAMNELGECEKRMSAAVPATGRVLASPISTTRPRQVALQANEDLAKLLPLFMPSSTITLALNAI